MSSESQASRKDAGRAKFETLTPHQQRLLGLGRVGVVALLGGMVAGGSGGGSGFGRLPQESDGSGEFTLTAFAEQPQPESSLFRSADPAAAPLDLAERGPPFVATAPSVAAATTEAAPRVELAESLGRPLASIDKHWPLLRIADGGGPFVFLSPPATNAQITRLPAQLAGEQASQPISPAEVIDLRTGAAVGRFDGEPPWWPDCRLSPDGMALAGPNPAIYYHGAENEPPAELTLQVWKRDAAQPHASLPMNGPVGWLRFLTDRRLAVLTWTPEAVVQLWDVESGTLEKAISLGEGYFPSPMNVEKATAKSNFYVPREMAGAVAPDGTHLAVAAPDGVRWVDLEAGKVVRTLPLGERNPRKTQRSNICR